MFIVYEIKDGKERELRRLHSEDDAIATADEITDIYDVEVVVRDAAGTFIAGYDGRPDNLRRLLTNDEGEAS